MLQALATTAGAVKSSVEHHVTQKDPMVDAALLTDTVARQMAIALLQTDARTAARTPPS
jgi:hypothetical protein